MRWVAVQASRSGSPVPGARNGGWAVTVSVPSGSTRLETGRMVMS